MRFMEESIVSVFQQNLANLNTSSEIVSALTPIIDKLCNTLHDSDDFSLVNVEDFDPETAAANPHKSDLFLIRNGLFKRTTPPSTPQSDTSHEYLFGKIPHIIMVGGVKCSFKCYESLTTETFESYTHYLNNVHKVRAATKKVKPIQCNFNKTGVHLYVIFDKVQLWLMKRKGTSVVSLDKLLWTTPGSKQTLLKFLSDETDNSVLNRALTMCCDKLHVRLPRSDAYLGHGYWGHVFLLDSGSADEQQAHKIALKLVLNDELFAQEITVGECCVLTCAVVVLALFLVCV